jgi:hypothetical protein
MVSPRVLGQRPQLGAIPAEEIATVITLLETGQTDVAVNRLRRLLYDNGFPVPQPIVVESREVGR